MGKARRSESSVVEGKDFLVWVGAFCDRCCLLWGYDGEESRELGVRGEAEPEEDSSLEGDSSGAEEAGEDTVVRLVAGWG